MKRKITVEFDVPLNIYDCRSCKLYEGCIVKCEFPTTDQGFECHDPIPESDGFIDYDKMMNKVEGYTGRVG